MLPDRWIIDRVPTERFPDYTRANAGEVLADPVTPLGWTFCWESGVVLGCREGFAAFGVFDADEYGDPPECFGLFGGYFYNSLTQARLLGVRMPGASPEQIDEAYFDEHPDVPPYVPEPWHESERHAQKLTETAGYVLSTEEHQPVLDQQAIAKRIRDERPDLSAASNEELIARARSLQPQMVDNFKHHVTSSLGASFGPGTIAAVAADLGRPEDGLRLITGIGDVDSADIARELWVLSRMIRSSGQLTAEFDAGLDGLGKRMAGTDFADAFAVFVYNHGSRGPNEWDPGAASYETNPGLAYAQLDVLRRQSDDADPVAALERKAAERAEIAAEIEELLADNEETLDSFRAGMKSSGIFLAARERSKCTNIRVIHEARMCFDELGRRMAEAGHIESPGLIYMLLEAELDDFLSDPGSFGPALAQREAEHLSLYDLEPPYIITHEAPPISEWPRKAEAVLAAAEAGSVLTGVACSPGTASGIARVILDPHDPSALGPGEIMVTVQTDPSWTPLFLAASAVVTNVGAPASHASIVSRELGIPCVASVPDATLVIPDGATVTVDGTAGTVTIDALP